MARERINTGGAAVMDEDATSGEQGNMFPDLDPKKPEHKAILKTAKELHKKDTEWKAYRGTFKEARDKLEQKLLGLMHEAGVKRFKHNELEAGIEEGKESVTVKVKPTGDDGETDADEE
jgi:hypothetical protein